MKYPQGMIISFFNVSYKVKIKHGYFYRRTKSTKEVLIGVSGIMKPGLNAIMGPLGSGKTTLLDILAARKEPSGFSGEVLVDGVQQPTNFNCIAGYVVYDYMMTGTLTVRENLEFCAALRLPKNLTKSERTKRINKLIEELGLSKIENSRIGTLLTRGVSDGERRKVSIAMELLKDPGVLFLDEPTSGLDTSNANAVLQLLRRLAQQGKTIIFSVHQPRYSMFKQFDSLTLLTNGKVMYHGPARSSIDHFKAMGYKFHVHSNPVDVVLDILCKAAANQMENGFGPTDQQGDSTVCETLLRWYHASTHFNQLMTQLVKLSDYSRLHQILHSPNHITQATSFSHQLKWLGRRIFRKYLGDPRVPILTVRSGLLFFIVNCQMYSSISSIELLVTEKKTLIHEYISGYYSLPAYFISKLLFEVIPLRTMPSIIYNSTTYFLAGLKRTVPAISISILTLVMVSYTSSALALAIAAGGNSVTIAIIMLSLTFVMMTIYSGLLVHLPGMVKWLSWLQYLSITRYGITALMVNEFVDLTFSYNVSDMGKGCHCPNPTPVEISCTGTQHLQDMGIGTASWDLWQNHVGLTVLITTFLCIAYLKLLYMKKFS
ncbi:broad substrate specificity ATP-binding cassette transporter ABCG2-like [Chiloscyllium punctatum]